MIDGLGHSAITIHTLSTISHLLQDGSRRELCKQFSSYLSQVPLPLICSTAKTLWLESTILWVP